MTESEWLTCADPYWMLHFVCFKIRPGDRKKRLFANHCCRRCWDLFTDKRSQYAVEVSERFAERQATSQELIAASEAACEVATEWRASLDRRRKGLKAKEEAALLLAAKGADVAWLLAGEMAWEVLGDITGAAETSFEKSDSPEAHVVAASEESLVPAA